MRYQVAVRALLKRLERRSDVAHNKLPASLAKQLTLTTAVQCSRFAAAWTHEVDGVVGPGAAAHDFVHAVRQTDNGEWGLNPFPRWGTLASQIPAFLLLLHLVGNGRMHPSLINANKSLLKSLIYNIPCKEASLQVYGLFRALLLCLLPQDLREATSIQLFGVFFSLSAIKAANDDLNGADKRFIVPRRSGSAGLLRRNAEVAEVVAQLPSSLKGHFAIQDDSALLRRLCEEFVRRLPPAGESLRGDYLKTLIEGQLDDKDRFVDPGAAYSLPRLLRTSSCSSVSREEFIMLTPKMVILEIKAQKKRNLSRAFSTGKARLKVDCGASRTFYSEESAAVIARTIANLSLVRHIDEVLACRQLLSNELLFLIIVGTSEEEKWSVATLPALRRALEYAEKQRLQRIASGAQHTAQKTLDTLFPTETLGHRMWLHRLYIGGLYALRNNRDALGRAVSQTMPLLADFARELRNSENLTLSSLLRMFNGMQAMRITTRCLWAINETKAVSKKPVHELDKVEGDCDDNEANAATSQASAGHNLLELNSEKLLEIVDSILSVMEGCLQREVGTLGNSGAASLPSVATKVEELPSAPRCGSGFARTRQPPPPPPRLEIEPQRFRSMGGDSSYVEMCDSVSQYVLESRVSYWAIVLERQSLSEERHRAAVAAALRIVAQSDVSFTSVLDKIKGTVQEIEDARRPADTDATQYYRADDEADVSPALLTYLDSFSHQKTTQLHLLSSLLRLTGNEALSAKERSVVVASFTVTAQQITTFVATTTKVHFLHHKLDLLIHIVNECYRDGLLASFERDARPDGASETLSATRYALRQLSCACLEMVNDIFSFTSSSSALPSWQRSSSSAAANDWRRSPQMLSMRLADTAVSLGIAAGLTSAEFPHLVPTVHRMMSTVGAFAEYTCRPPTAVTGGPAGSGSSRAKVLTMLSVVLHRLCLFGLCDDSCFAAATKALRQCGTEEVIKATPPRARCAFLAHAGTINRVLSTRASTSRETRRLMKQMLVVAARMTSDRLAYEDEAVDIKGLNAKMVLTHWTNKQAVLMWMLASTAMVTAASSATEDKCIQALLQFIKRRLEVPTCPDYTVPSSPAKVDYLNHCETILRTVEIRDFMIIYQRMPTTPAEVLKVSNMIIRSLDDNAKVTYQSISADLSNSATTAQRARWHMHMEVFATIVDSFQTVLAPSIWYRVLRECHTMHHISTYFNMATPLMHDTLVLALERTLIFSQAHHNTGTWWYSHLREAESDGSGATLGDPHADVLSRTRLVPYHRAARYLGFHEHIQDMNCRVYLVELTEQLLLEVSSAEENNSVPSCLIDAPANVVEENKVKFEANARSGRTGTLWTFRKMRV